MTNNLPGREANVPEIGGGGLLVSLGKIAGIGGISVGTLFLLFHQFLSETFIKSANLSSADAYKLLLLLLLFVFGIAVAGLSAWALGQSEGRLLAVSLLLFALALSGLGVWVISYSPDKSGITSTPEMIIAGTVTAAATGNPLDSVRFRLNGSGDKDLSTSATGKFKIDAGKPHRVDLVIRAAGYKDYETTLNSSDYDLYIQMTPQ